MKARVKVNVSQWAWGDGDESHVLPGGTHSLEGISKDFAGALAAAAAADPGTIEILSSDDAFKSATKAAVESEANSRKTLASVVVDGLWYPSNLEAQIANFEGIAAEARASLADAEGSRRSELEGVIVRAEHSKKEAADALAALGGEA